MTQKIVYVKTLADIMDRQPTYLALGSFDGVHLGHQTILRKMVDAAQTDGVRSAVLTFFPHPKRVIQELPTRYYINTLEDRLALLSAQRVDMVIAHPFNDGVRNIRAADFVDQLRDSLDMRQIWGGNFAFGYRREGDRDFHVSLDQKKVLSYSWLNLWKVGMATWSAAVVSGTAWLSGILVM